MLVRTRKAIVYLDQYFPSRAYRGEPQCREVVRRIDELQDLELIAVPYSSSYSSEPDMPADHRHAVTSFAQTLARGRGFEPDYRVEEAQISKAFQAYLDDGPASYVREERDVLKPSVHHWDRSYFARIDQPVPEAQHRTYCKKRRLQEALKILNEWAAGTNGYEHYMHGEMKGIVRRMIESYAGRTARFWTGNLGRLLDDPVNTSTVEFMLYVLRARGVSDAQAIIDSFFQSEYFNQVPSQYLSHCLLGAFRRRVREGRYAFDEQARGWLNGFFFDLQHCAIYPPYCDAFLVNPFMADLLNDPGVAVEVTFGCRVFSLSALPDFFQWLGGLRANMTAEHAEALAATSSKWSSRDAHPPALHYDTSVERLPSGSLGSRVPSGRISDGLGGLIGGMLPERSAVFERMVYLASMRGPEGRYDLPAGFDARSYRPDEVDEFLWREHRTAYQDWLRLSLEEQAAGLTEYAHRSGKSAAEVALEQLDPARIHRLVPRGCSVSGPEAQLLAGDAQLLLTVVAGSRSPVSA